MTLREELYNTSHQIRVEEDAERRNAHKIFADIYLKQKCRVAAAEGKYAVLIDTRTTLDDGLSLTKKDVEDFASENSLDFDPDIWELCFTQQ